MNDTERKIPYEEFRKSIFNKPVYLLGIIFISIFLSEAIIMIALNLLPPLETEQDVLLDSLTLVIIIPPILYLLALKPLKAQIHFCEDSERQKDNLIKELHQALEEVKSLQGIIPICASCKNIRNDEGF